MANSTREDNARAMAEADKTLTKDERSKVADTGRLSALAIFAVIRREGEEELQRPAASLWWSSIAAGLGLSTSVLTQGILHHELAGIPGAAMLEYLGYSFGFVIVILSRLQLFTENTLSVVLPVLSKPTTSHFLKSARLWGIVLLGNLIGTFATTFISLKMQTTSPEHLAAMMDVSRHAAEIQGWEAFVRGIPAGFYMAAIVWMLPSSKGFEIAVIVLFSWLIAAGGFAHVVAGSTEMFLLLLHGEISLWGAFGGYLIPALFGNIMGGTGLFALLSYAQIKSEIEP